MIHAAVDPVTPLRGPAWRTGWMGCKVIFLGKAYAEYAIADAVPWMQTGAGMIRVEPKNSNVGGLIPPRNLAVKCCQC